MANEFRRPIDEFFGTISAGITALETTLQSEQFSRLDDLYSTALYLPLVLADDTTQVIEVVYVRGHTAGSNTITVLRGQEGTTARQWPVGTTFRAAPTVRDGAQALMRAAVGLCLLGIIMVSVRTLGFGAARTIFTVPLAFGAIALAAAVMTRFRWLSRATALTSDLLVLAAAATALLVWLIAGGGREPSTFWTVWGR